MTIIEFAGQLRVFLVFWVLLMSGCSERRHTASTQPVSAIDQLRAHVSAERWEDAWNLSDEVLITAHDDPDTLELIAKVAFRTNRKSVAADLMVDAAMAGSALDRGRVQQALSALLAVGRLFDGIELLAKCVHQLPQDTTLRRSLVDLLTATQQYTQAKPHIEVLVHQREFDDLLLMAGYLAESHAEEFSSLDEVMSRNPGDRRLKVNVAKQSLSRGEFDESINLLRSIVDQHPEFMAAQTMLGRALVQSGSFDEAEAWAQSVPVGTEQDPAYWLTMGDLAAHRRDIVTATIAYGKAAKLDFDRVEPWVKLASACQQTNLVIQDHDAIQERATQLSKLRQSYAEYLAGDQDKPDSLIQLSHRLVALGRLWEAEAWTAIGSTRAVYNESETGVVSELRAGVLAKLSRNTPWQSSERLPAWSWLKSAAVVDHPLITSESKPERQHWRPSVPTSIALKNEAVQRNVDFFGRTAEDLESPGILNFQMLGCGGAAIDFDHDGWPDLYFAAAGGTPPLANSAPNAMLRNLEGRFVNVANYCGAEDRGFGQGVAVGDMNEDGFDDLLVLNYGPNSVWLNNGDGTFANHSARWLPTSSTWSTSAAIADLDGDSLSDLVIVNYCAGLAPVSDECPVGNSAVIRACSPNHFRAQRDLFLRGTSTGGLVDATETWNAIPETLGRGLGIVAGSFDEHPGIDLLIANDMTSNHCWVADTVGGEEFALQEKGVLLGLANDASSRSQGSMGIAVADFNLDGKADFYVSNYESEYNTLYLADSHSQWRDETSQAGLVRAAMPMVGFGTQAADLDNNGQCELVVANGHIDHYQRDNQDILYAQPMQIFEHASGGGYESIANRIDDEYFRTTHVGRGLWTIDANRDGRIDLIATHQTEPPALLVNHSSSAYATVALRLVATRSSRNAVGSEITVRTDAGTLRGHVTSGDGYFCSNERVVRFGLGETQSVIEVMVRWPNGETQTWTDIEPHEDWLLVQNDSPFKL